MDEVVTDQREAEETLKGKSYYHHYVDKSLVLISVWTGNEHKHHSVYILTFCSFECQQGLFVLWHCGVP